MYKPTKAYLEQAKSRSSSTGNASHRSQQPMDPNKVDQKTGLKLPVLAQSRAEGEACFCCGSKDHKLNKCQVKNKIPRDQWSINKFNKMKPQFMQDYKAYLDANNNNPRPPTSTKPPVHPNHHQALAALLLAAELPQEWIQWCPFPTFYSNRQLPTMPHLHQPTTVEGSNSTHN